MPKQRYPIKRVWLILTFPFRLICVIISSPFKIAFLIIKHSLKRPRKNTKRKDVKEIDFLGLGKLLYADFATEFEVYYNSFLADGKQFYKKFKSIIQSDSNSNLKPIDVLRLFGDYKQLIAEMDWKGEEDENELDEFIESQIKQNIVWTQASLLRASVEEKLQRDGKFILKLFEAIDKDLQAINKRLLFFETDFDAYALMPVEKVIYNEIIKNAAGYFQGADDLY